MWKAFIVERGITKVAEDIGVTRQTVHNWLKDASRVDDNSKRKLVDLSGGAFGIMDFFTELKK